MRNFSRKYKNPTINFEKYMNILASKLNLSQTYFGNVHGLLHRENKSTAYDIAKLCCIAMRS